MRTVCRQRGAGGIEAERAATIVGEAAEPGRRSYAAWGEDVGCDAEDVGGKALMASQRQAFAPNVQHAQAGDGNDAVKQGVPEAGMPSYGKYATTSDVSGLKAYLKSVGTASQPTWWNWWLPHPVQ